MQTDSKKHETPTDANNVLVAGVPLKPEYWTNEIREELYVRCRPAKTAQRLIRYYRSELLESNRYYACH